MKALTLDAGKERAFAFASAALALRCGDHAKGQPPAPITAEQLTEARWPEDVGPSLWNTFRREQENTVARRSAGTQRPGPPAVEPGGRQHRPRRRRHRALWVLAEDMRRLKR